MIPQVRHLANAAVVTDDIIAPTKVDHEASIRFSENRDIGADDAHYVITATKPRMTEAAPTPTRKRRSWSFVRKTDVTFLHLPHTKQP